MSKLETINSAIATMEVVSEKLSELNADWRIRRRALEVTRELVLLKGEEAQRQRKAVRT